MRRAQEHAWIDLRKDAGEELIAPEECGLDVAAREFPRTEGIGTAPESRCAFQEARDVASPVAPRHWSGIRANHPAAGSGPFHQAVGIGVGVQAIASSGCAFVVGVTPQHAELARPQVVAFRGVVDAFVRRWLDTTHHWETTHQHGVAGTVGAVQRVDVDRTTFHRLASIARGTLPALLGTHCGQFEAIYRLEFGRGAHRVVAYWDLPIQRGI